MLIQGKANMKMAMLITVVLSLCAVGSSAQTNQTDKAKTPPPAPPSTPSGSESINLLRIPASDPSVPKRVEIEGALARLR